MSGSFPGEDGLVADVLRRGHRSYLEPIVLVCGPLVGAEDHVRIMTHITGFGIPGNRDRALPVGVDAWRLGASMPGSGRVTLS